MHIADLDTPTRSVNPGANATDLENWPAFNALHAQWAGTSRPSRAVVPTGALHHGLKVEVEAVAMVGG